MSQFFVLDPRYARRNTPRMLTSEELADCCGGCRTNSAIETWMQRAIAKFCEVNGITFPRGVATDQPNRKDGNG